MDSSCDSWILHVTTGCDQCLSEIYVVGPWKTSQFKMATSASLKTPELLSFNNLCYVCYKCDLSIHGVLGQDRRVLRQSFVIWEPCSLWVDSVLQIKISPAKASSNRADPVRYLPLGRQSLPLAKSTLWVSAQAFCYPSPSQWRECVQQFLLKGFSELLLGRGCGEAGGGVSAGQRPGKQLNVKWNILASIVAL